MLTIRRIATWLVWPVLLGAFLTAFALTQHLGYDPGLSLLAVTIGHFLVIMVLEIVMPARRDWIWLGDWQAVNDLIHGALLDVGGRLGTGLLTIAIASLGASLTQTASWNIWPSHLPFLVQIAIAILIYDFLDYWKHRAFHHWVWLWPIHALHHNPARMHIFKAGRLHFLEATARALITAAPLVLMGAPPELFLRLESTAS